MTTLIEQADDVRARADHVTLVGERPLESARAAEAIAALEHEHRLAGSREVCGAREPVVPSADDDRVPMSRGECGDRLRQADFSQPGGDGGHGPPNRPFLNNDSD